MMESKNHSMYMKMAINLAKKGRGKVSPNPMVGCVIIKNDRIIGEGYHHEFGKNHAPDISKRELLEAMTEISETGEGPKIQYPSIGCSIKWR